MIDTLALEVCAECLVTVSTGRGEPHRLDTLWRKFRGQIVISEVDSIVTFRPCGGCGGPSRGVLFAAVMVIRHEEEANG